MVKLPVSSITFGADAQEKETIYIEGTNLSYTISHVQGGSVALYGLEPHGRGYLFTATANEWQDSETSNIDDIIFSDGKDTATLRVETRKSPSGMLVFDADYFDFPWSGSSKALIFKLVGISDTSTVHVGIEGEVNNAGISPLTKVTDGTYQGTLTVEMKANGKKFRTGLAYVTATDEDGYTMRRDIQCMQSSRKVFPCWQDEMLDIPVGSFDIVDTDKNKTVYSGYSEKGEVNVGRIVRPLLRSSYDIEFSDDFIKDETATLNFSVQQDGVELQNYMTYDDYSLTGAENILNDPIQMRLAEGQPYIISVLNTTGGDDTIKLDGSEVNIPVGVSHYGYYLENNKTLSAEYNGASISWQAEKWCGRYIIFYVNAAGGVDWLLTEGNSLKNDSISNGRYEQVYSNGSVKFGKTEYLKTATRKIALHTGWLTDDESMRMHNLLESARVWLYDMEENEISPVLIADTSMDYKTFDNQGRQLVQYDLNLEFSHTFQRR